MAINASFFLFLLNLLPETMPESQCKVFKWSNLNPFLYVKTSHPQNPVRRELRAARAAPGAQDQRVSLPGCFVRAGVT